MPLRMAIDSGAVDPQDVALVGARSLDPPEEAFILETGSTRARTASPRRSTASSARTSRSTSTGSTRTRWRCSCRSRTGSRWREAEALLRDVARRSDVLGAGVTGLRPDPANVEPVDAPLRAPSGL